MTTMRCEAVRDALPALARGALDDAEAAEVRTHLAACDECSDAWAVVGALAAARVSAPAGLADRVSAEVKRRGAHGSGAPRRSVRPLHWLGATGLAAAAMIAAVLAWPNADAGDATRTLALPETATLADPFLQEELFGATTPTEAETDGMIRVAAADLANLPAAIAAELDAGETEDVAPLAMDVGSPLGDWPGADGMSAGEMMIDDLSIDEMELLLTEMET